MYKYNDIIKLIAKRYGVFTLSDFGKDKNDNLRKHLNRLVDKGELTSVSKGLYFLPYKSKTIDTHDVVEAISRKNKWVIAFYGASCLNYLGLSTQVPYFRTYASTGPSRTYKINGCIIKFNHSSNKDLIGYDKITRSIIQSIKFIGPKNYDDEIINKLISTLKANNIVLKRNKLNTSTTIQNVMNKIYRKLDERTNEIIK